MFLPCIITVFVFVTAGAVPAAVPKTCEQLSCSHACVEKGEWTSVCACPNDLFLDVDKKTCREPVTILLSMFRGIKKFKEGSASELQTVLPLRVSAFDFHIANKEIYAFANNNITRYSFNDELSKASAPVTILPVDSTVTSLAVDWVGGRLYWVCDQQSTLESSTTDGTQRKTIITSEDNPKFRDVVVDPHSGKIFWISSKGIYTASLSGDNIKTLNTSSGNVIPEHLALDANKQLIYVIGNHGNGNKAIAKYQYDGSQVGSTLDLPGHKDSQVFGFGVLGDQVFWQSNKDGENMYKIDITSNLKVPIVNLVEEIDQIVYSLKIFHPDVQKHKTKLSYATRLG